jgi:hypothetical protein
MKIRPTWQFWALLGLGYLSNGWRGVSGILVLILALTALGFLIFVFTSDFRNFLIKEKGFSADGRFVRFFCKLKLHTWGEVIEDVPQTEIGKLRQRSYRLKFGTRKSLCCGKDQVVSALLDSKYWGRLEEKYYDLREDCR